MAELKRIEELCQKVGYDAPDWVYPNNKQTPDGGHLSGALRELEGKTNDFEDYTNAQADIANALMDAAEHLDDAHQEWLEIKYAVRSLLNDIEAMKAPNPNAEQDDSYWYGPFSDSHYDEDRDCGGEFVEWPNLEISSAKLEDLFEVKS